MTVSCAISPAARRVRLDVVLSLFLVLGVLACADLSRLAGTQAAPSGAADPNNYHTADGALGLYHAVLATAEGTTTTAGAFVDFTYHSGLMSDELEVADLNCTSNGSACPPSGADAESARLLPIGSANPTDGLYTELQQVRGQANEAIGGLAAWAPSAAPALRGELYALQGYAEIALADLFCSGVPLSTLDFNADYTYQAGSPTTAIYQDAVTKLDTALTLSTADATLSNLARVLQGRALLNEGQYAAAATAVAAVPDGFTYQELVQLPNPGAGQAPLFQNEADQKGSVGLPFRSSQDPRTATDAADSSVTIYGQSVYNPNKYLYATGPVAPLILGDWIEARLIRAEAALQAGNPASWLNQLNTLRKSATVNGQLGTLDTLTDPGVGLSASAADSARVTLLFQERAYWLYLSGHRLGDLRRLIRQYRRSESHVFPSGHYNGVGGGATFLFSEQVFAPIPTSESVNPKFTGCLSLGA